MNAQLFHDLAASEESSGYHANARALRAVPDMYKVLECAMYTMIALSKHHSGNTNNMLWTQVNAARAALAELEDET